MSLCHARLCLSFNVIIFVILARFTSAWNMPADETHKNDCYQKPSEDLTEDTISGAYLVYNMVRKLAIRRRAKESKRKIHVFARGILELRLQLNERYRALQYSPYSHHGSCRLSCRLLLRTLQKFHWCY